MESILAYESPVGSDKGSGRGQGLWRLVCFEEHALGQVLTSLGFSQLWEGVIPFLCQQDLKMSKQEEIQKNHN